ncbi:hypothetical protein NP233_g4944 [Leucocoprinus birnbaumii]|uniref:Carbonic anhydrase n=1 Tax=Leucocoprinus birnbaumii TaxID=56174 RepID=A0AAD5YV17_9AGAR|nr:hypothetical protein NP233_g4944 [Leucocoprinus birnbaumii]
MDPQDCILLSLARRCASSSTVATSTSGTNHISSTSTSSSSAQSSAASAQATPAHNITATHNEGMKGLFEGNSRFRSGHHNATSATPSFMVLGCSDNRISSEAIFNASIGSIMSQNNIGNQFMQQDLGTQAAFNYAVDGLKVHHVIVMGHYGCKGVEHAIAMPGKQKTSGQRWLKPISDLFSHSKRKEIETLRKSRKPQKNKKNAATIAPKADDPGLKALVEENVKNSVDTIKKHSVLTTAYKKKKHSKANKQQDIHVFVHGFVYDENNGEVKNLGISFGPPGQKIPDIPFAAVEATKESHGVKKTLEDLKGKGSKVLSSLAVKATQTKK